MAARADAAARSSQIHSSVFVFFCLLSLLCQALSKQLHYGRAELLKIGNRCQNYSSGNFSSIPPEILLSGELSGTLIIPPAKRRRRRRDRKQKRGKRAGIRARLQANPNRPALPSLFLTNSRSLVNKMDEVRLRIISHRLNNCVMVITETWLDSAVPDAAIELAGRSVYRADRTSDSGKNKGGGVCIYINNDWCTSADIIRSHCSPDIEYMSLKCRPFYTPREFAAIVITAVYIPPRANAKLALEELHEAINSQLNAYPEGAVIVAGDFNHVDLKTVMPKLHTSIHFPTRDNSILDQVYTNIPEAYKAAPSPHLGLSDHISIHLTPSYRPLICRTKPTVKTVQVWNEESSSRLQDCFENTDWDLFASTDLEEYSSSVLAYIAFCTDSVLTTKTSVVFPNQEPWFDRNVCSLLRVRNAAYRSGDRQAYRNARKDLKKRH